MIEAHGREHDGQTSGMALQDEPGRTVVRVWGEIDLEVRRDSADLCQAVADRGLPVVIDARGVTFIDSTGMSILVRLARDGEAGGYPVTLHNAPWMLRELLSITGVDRLLPLTDDEDVTPGEGSGPSV
ncbi:STAS domain-containing protein [Cellulomonas sp. KRMCY2]|uniref:STAS domain-containing protein n=1 Tax=Cellulomonas sp. KRMCY2 TaxID=1304865 RepID=UPI00045EB349|nr:STAS domain-containing protein [Cellulomonas sp. KRMCY2]